jgi:hypothetical protein
MFRLKGFKNQLIDLLFLVLPAMTKAIPLYASAKNALVTSRYA